MGPLITVGSIAAFCVFFASKPALALRAIATFLGFILTAVGFLFEIANENHHGTPYLFCIGAFLLFVVIRGASSSK